MFSTASNCTIIGSVENCGFGKFCCVDGCCTDFTYYLILLIVLSMVVTVAIFIYVEVVKQRNFNENLRKHREKCAEEQKMSKNMEFEESRIYLGAASPIEPSMNLPPSCSPPMLVPKLKFHKNRSIFHHKH